MPQAKIKNIMIEFLKFLINSCFGVAFFGHGAKKCHILKSRSFTILTSPSLSNPLHQAASSPPL